MADTICELVDALRRALVDKLTARGELESGETISIRAIIVGSDKKARNHLLIDKGLDTSRRGRNAFYDRELTPDELEMLRKISLVDQWQQGVVLEILNNNNNPISADALPELALAHGYRVRTGMGGKKAELWPTKVLSGINRSLRATSQPFRILQAEERKVDKSWPTKFYRFYRMIEETQEDVP